MTAARPTSALTAPRIARLVRGAPYSCSRFRLSETASKGSFTVKVEAMSQYQAAVRGRAQENRFRNNLAIRR